jgi:hypothetical protein
MPITVTCPKCGAVVRGGDHLLGRTAACPRCRVPVRLPDLVEVEPEEDEEDEPLFFINSWRIGAFVCWGVGAALIIIPAFLIARSGPLMFRETYLSLYLLTLLGVLFVGAGNALQRIAGRERRD